MSEKMGSKFTVRIEESIPKTLHSRDSAERLVRTVVSMWRARPGAGGRNVVTLVLDFEGIREISESAAGALIGFREQFSEDKDPEIEFSNMSASVDKTFAAVGKSLRNSSARGKGRKRKPNGFSIEL